MMNKTKIRSFDDARLKNLKLASYQGNVVKGIKEVVKLIKAGKVEDVFIADNDLGDKYSSIIKEYLKAYLDQEPIEIADYTILRDIVMKRYSKETMEMNEARYEKEKKRRGPRCYCAAIIKITNTTGL